MKKRNKLKLLEMRSNIIKKLAEMLSIASNLHHLRLTWTMRIMMKLMLMKRMERELIAVADKRSILRLPEFSIAFPRSLQLIVRILLF